MPLYLGKFSYTPKTWTRLINKPEDRGKAAQSYIKSAGEKLHDFWYAFVSHDGYDRWEAPDNVSMAAATLAIIGGGDGGEMASRHMKLVCLLFSLLALYTMPLVAQPVGRPHSVAASDTSPVTSRGLDNLVAFARLVGYVRYFHPTDEAVRMNWSAFIVGGAQAVEPAPNADSLASTLRSLFAVVAPTVVVHRAGTRPASGPAPPPGTPDSALGVIVWRHYGFAEDGSQSEVYLSARVRVPAPAGRVPARMALAEYYTPSTGPNSMPVADPRMPLEVALGGGVAASVPLAIWTTLSDVPDSLRLPRPAPSNWRASPAERAGRIADVIAYWNFAQHSYPYFDVVKVDWPAALRAGLREVATADSTRHIRAIQRLASALHDGHAFVADTSHLPGYASLWLAVVERRIVVTAVGDSARPSGIAVGDEILKVDSVPAFTALADEEAHVNAASPQFRRMSGLVALTAGPRGSMLRLQIRSADQGPREIVVRRNARGPAREKRPDAIAELEPGIVYLDWTRITTADSGTFLPKVRSARGVVVDMRGYPVRLDATAFLDLFSNSPLRSAPLGVPVLPRPDREGMVFRDVSWPVTRGKWGAPLRTPVVFITYAGAMSWAETIMGIVDGYHLGPIVGEATAGSNGNNNVIQLPTGLLAGLTGMRVQKHDGSTLHGVGIIPTVSVTRTLKGVREGRDEYLERALDALSVEIKR